MKLTHDTGDRSRLVTSFVPPTRWPRSHLLQALNKPTDPKQASQLTDSTPKSTPATQKSQKPKPSPALHPQTPPPPYLSLWRPPAPNPPTPSASAWAASVSRGFEPGRTERSSRGHGAGTAAGSGPPGPCAGRCADEHTQR